MGDKYRVLQQRRCPLGALGFRPSCHGDEWSSRQLFAAKLPQLYWKHGNTEVVAGVAIVSTVVEVRVPGYRYRELRQGTAKAMLGTRISDMPDDQTLIYKVLLVKSSFSLLLEPFQLSTTYKKSLKERREPFTSLGMVLVLGLSNTADALYVILFGTEHLR